MSSPSSVWFRFLDAATGQQYKKTQVDVLTLPSGSSVGHFRQAVHLSYSSILTGIAYHELLVYKNEAAFDKSTDQNDPDGVELYPAQPLDGIGESAETPLIVVVPSKTSTDPSETKLKEKGPKSIRKQRWRELNQIISAKKAKNKDSTAYSYVTWTDVNLVFNPVAYEQKRQNIDDDKLSFLAKYISMTTKVFGKISTGKEAKRLHFIAPILICVCALFDGQVGIVAEEDLVGSRVKAHGHFEFMITHGKKTICIVEAKKDDIDQGMAQDLLGCEVAADIEELDLVCGIVTNYVQWNFFRSFNDRVEMEECSLDLTRKGPEQASLKKIAEKIYGMLKEDE
jgi:hypothetical protein